MKKYSKNGFAFAGMVGLLSVALLLGVVALTAYSALNKNSNPQSQASNVVDTTLLDESIPATTWDMKLTVVPTLGTSFGQVNLAMSWNPNVRQYLNDRSQLQRFRVTVRREPFTDANNLISSPTDSRVDPVGSTKTFANLSVDNNKTYYVQLRAVYVDGADGNKTKVKQQRVEFKYYGDRFESSAINSFWQTFQDGQYSKVSISPGATKNNLVTEVFRGKGDSAYLYNNVDLSKGFSSSVEITKAALSLSGKTSQDKSIAGQFFNKGTAFSYGAWIENTGLSLAVSSGQSRGSQTGFDYTYGNSLTTSTYPIKLSFNYDGQRISSKLGDQPLDSNSGVKIDALDGLKIGSWTGGPKTNASAMFNNFQIVWVKK